MQQEYHNIKRYHSSNIQFNVGDLLISKIKESIKQLKHNSLYKEEMEHTWLVENIFEKIRKKKFPTKPSRLESVFVKFDPNHLPILRDFTYSVICTGITHTTDQEYYTTAMGTSQKDYLEELAITYWMGIKENELSDSSEILIAGKVIIEKQL